MFLHIKDEGVLSDKKVLLHMAEIIPSYEGWHSIEENLRVKLKEHIIEWSKYFYLIEEEFDIHYKDEKKITQMVGNLKWNSKASSLQ